MWHLCRNHSPKSCKPLPTELVNLNLLHLILPGDRDACHCDSSPAAGFSRNRISFSSTRRENPLFGVRREAPRHERGHAKQLHRRGFRKRECEPTTSVATPGDSFRCSTQDQGNSEILIHQANLAQLTQAPNEWQTSPDRIRSQCEAISAGELLGAKVTRILQHKQLGCQLSLRRGSQKIVGRA